MWLNILEFFYDLIKSEKEIADEQKKKLVNFFEQVHQLLQEVVTSLQNETYPQGSCAAMSAISNGLVDNLKDKIEAEELNKLTRMLDEASVLEKEWNHRKDPQVINSLLTISGEFKALAILYAVR